MHLVYTGCGPVTVSHWIGHCNIQIAMLSWPALRSANSQQYEVPRTEMKFEEQAFSFSGPAAWNAPTPDYIIYWHFYYVITT